MQVILISRNTKRNAPSSHCTSATCGYICKLYSISFLLVLEIIMEKAMYYRKRSLEIVCYEQSSIKKTHVINLIILLTCTCMISYAF